MARYQAGSLRVENRAKGKTWVLRFYINKAGRRVENTMPIGLVSDFPTEFAARKEMERQHLDINDPDFQGPYTFERLARHYVENELDTDQDEAVVSKSPSTIGGYKRNLTNYILPRWGKDIALDIKPLQVERWLKGLKKSNHLKNPTVDKLRRLMNLIFKSAQRYGLIPREKEANPKKFVRCRVNSDYESLTVTPQQAWEMQLRLPIMESTLTLLAASTGMRISECLGLQWGDVDFVGEVIHVRRVWTAGQQGDPKSAASRAAVTMHPLLANRLKALREWSIYSKETDWCFPSFRLRGKKPRTGNMLVEDHLRPIATKMGILKEGDTKTRFGFHVLRHSLASFLVQQGKNATVVKEMMRHSDVQTTLNIYSHGRSEDRMAAQADYLTAMQSGTTTQ
jgi:integrase